MPYGVTDNDWVQVLRGVARGEYRVLLGAGASRDSENSKEQLLPTSSGLTDLIKAEFKIPDDGSVDLKRAYEAAGRKSRTNAKGETIDQFLARYLVGCQPADWYSYLCERRWARIWTLNIDDVVEQAYKKWEKTRAQRPKAINWTDLFEESDTSQNEVILVHLHGIAGGKGDTRKSDIIFDIVQYKKAGNLTHAWHRVFGDEFASKPFIVVGAKLADEYDFADHLRMGNNSRSVLGRPSLVVLNSFNELQIEEFNDWGLIPITSSASGFFQTLANDVLPYEDEVRRTRLAGHVDKNGEPFRFNQQFESLQQGSRSQRREGGRFYSGFDPTWSDILDDLDARLEVVDRVMPIFKDGAKGDGQRVVCLSGPRFTGKSTALLRIGRDLLGSGLDVYRFRGEMTLDIEATAWWLGASPGAVLLFDGMADFAGDLGRLCAVCRDRRLALNVVGTERSKRMEEIYRYIPDEVLHAGSGSKLVMNSLSDVDIDRLLAVLHSHTRLGRIQIWSRDKQREYFRHTHRRKLFGALAGLEAGAGFLARLRQQTDAIGNTRMRDAYAVSCMAYEYGYPVPIAILADSAGVSVQSLSHELRGDGVLSDLLEVNLNGAVKPMHRTAATLVVDSLLDSDERYRLSQQLMVATIPYISGAAFRQRTIPYRILRNVMSYEYLKVWVGRDAAVRWYSEFEDEFDWNFRYWEQRALAEAGAGIWETAESYAVRAVKLRADDFTLNTLGTVLLKKACYLARWDAVTAMNYYRRGVEALWHSLDAQQVPGYHQYKTFFEYTNWFVDDSKQGGRIDQEIVVEWDRWWNRARYAPIFRHGDMQEQLRTHMEQWAVRKYPVDGEADREIARDKER